MTRQLLICCLLLAAAPVAQQRTESLDALFQLAVHKETVTGDLKGAIADYRRIADAARHADRRLASQALLRLAGCHDTLGEASASAVHEEIIRQFADQAEAVAVSRAYLNRTRRPTPGRPGAPTERSLWAGAGVPLEAAITPDGRFLAYPDFSNNGNLSLRDVTSGVVRALTTTADSTAAQPQYAGALAFSADGKQLAYAWLVADNQNGEDSAYWELRVRSMAQTDPADGRLLYRHDRNMWFAPVGWTPDGERILVAMSRPDRTRQIGLVSLRDGTLAVVKTMNWRGSSGLAISPDGRWVAFDTPANDETSQRDIFVVALDGSQEAPVLMGPSRDTVISWAKDGKYLIFESDRRGPNSLWAQPMEGARPAGEPVLLLAHSRGFTRSVARDTGAICQLVMTDNRTIHTAPVDLVSGHRVGGVSAPLRTPWPAVNQPRFSPDGKSLAFDTQRMPNAAPDGFISVQTLATGRILEVPVKLTFVWDYQWTPDSKGFIMRATDYKGRHGIFRAELDGEVTPIALTREGERFVAPRLSPDGARAMYVRAGTAEAPPTAIIQDLESGKRRELPLPFKGRIVGFSPDGRLVAGLQSTGNATELWIASIDNGNGRRVLELPGRNGVRGVDWRPDSKGLVFIASRNSPSESMEAWSILLDGAAPVKLDIEATKMAGNYVSVSPDGSALAFLAGDPLKFEMRLLENYLPASTETNRAAAVKR